MEHIAELLGVTPAEVLGTAQLLRDVQARAGRQVPRQHLHEHLLPARSAASELLEHAEETPRHQGRAAPPPTALFTLEDVECIAACTEAPVPAGELPLLLQGHQRRLRPADRRPARRPARRRGPAARHAGAASASTSRPTGAAGTRARRRQPGLDRARPTDGGRAPSMTVTGRARRSSPAAFGRRRRPHARRLRQRTGGYEALRKALGHDARSRSPTRSRPPSLLGRGGAGFPAGTKWGFLPPDVLAALPRRQRRRERAGHLQGPHPHGARPAPAHRGHARSPATPSARRRRFLYVRGEMALAQERIAAGAQRGVRTPGYVGKNILGTGLLRRHRPALGRRRLHRRRGDRAHREPRGQPGHAPAQAAVLPGGQGPLPAAHDRQQRRDAVEPPVDHRATAATRSRRSAPSKSTGTRMFAVSGHVNRPGRLRGRVRRHDLPRPHLRRRATAAASGTAASSRRSSPAARRRRGSSRSTSTCRSTRPTVDKAGSMLGLGRDRRHGRDHRRGAGVPGGSCASSPASRAASARRAARARRGSSRSCAASSTATAAASDLDLLMDVSDNISPGLVVAAEADHDLPARPVGHRADRVGGPAVPRRVRRSTSPTAEAAVVLETTSPTRRRRRVASPSTAGSIVGRARASWSSPPPSAHGVYIPRFCYHPRMKPVGMCRMCLVEVDGRPRPGAAARAA